MHRQGNQGWKSASADDPGRQISEEAWIDLQQGPISIASRSGIPQPYFRPANGGEDEIESAERKGTLAHQHLLATIVRGLFQTVSLTNQFPEQRRQKQK